MSENEINVRRRRVLQAAGATLLLSKTGAFADLSKGPSMNSISVQLILRNGQFTTLDRQNPQATAVSPLRMVISSP